MYVPFQAALPTKSESAAFVLRMKKVVLVLVVCLACLALGYFLGAGRASSVPPTPQRDTLVIRDTVRLETPKPIKETIIRFDTLTLTDTLLFSDTVYVEIPITSKVYEDSLYKAWVSGYKARLDSIEVYPIRTIETVYVPQVKRTRWGIGLQAGFGTDLRGGWVPYVGVGVSYSLWGW